MMLMLTRATLATVDELFRYKSQGFELESFKVCYYFSEKL